MDWQSIVSRLTFYSAKGDKRYQIYDTDHLFVLGDLNYRTSKLEPVKLEKKTFDTLLKQQRYQDLLAHDQLKIESSAGRTAHSLVEGEIAFPPSYKYKKGTNQLVVGYHPYVGETIAEFSRSPFPSECPVIATAFYTFHERICGCRSILR